MIPRVSDEVRLHASDDFFALDYSCTMDSPDPFAALDLDEPTEVSAEAKAPRDAVPELSLLDSFARPESRSRAEPTISAPSDPHVRVVDPEVVRMEMISQAPAGVAAAAPSQRRGRSRGTTKHASELAGLLRSDAVPAHVPVTQRERASAAGKASARKRKEAKAANRSQSTLAAGQPAASSVDPCLAIIPLVHEAASQEPRTPLQQQE